jgi:NADH:ubiquinone oxidoreductase subunit D
MVGTYSGVLEGDRISASPFIRKHLTEMAARIMPPGYPLAVVEPPKGELPQWLCISEFESSYGVHNTGPDFNSLLYVCWLMEDTARSLDEIIESILPQIDWERLAEDYDIMNF